jgi:hypothetical protein
LGLKPNKVISNIELENLVRRIHEKTIKCTVNSEYRVGGGGGCTLTHPSPPSPPFTTTPSDRWKWWSVKLMYIKLPMYLFFYMALELNDSAPWKILGSKKS